MTSKPKKLPNVYVVENNFYDVFNELLLTILRDWIWMFAM